MLSIVANVFYVLIAIAMVALILLQRGAGANAGSGFGGGASATVFGARGSANFLSRSTAVLAGLFFLLSLGMGIFLARSATSPSQVQDLGIMADVPVPASEPAAPAAADVPAPASAAPATDAPAPAAADVPAAPATEAEKPQVPPAESAKDAVAAPEQKGKDGK